MSILTEYLNPEQKEQVNKEVDDILTALKADGRGARVFCVTCGAINKTLYKHGNIYLCKECKRKVEERAKEKESK